MVFVTGDCHGDFSRFTAKNFPKKKELTRNDIMIICGDFGGIWNGGDEEEGNLKFLSELPFTVVFCDGNHENFNRLSSCFPVVQFHDGQAHKIRENVYHLMRGYVFTFEGKKFWVMGGAQSHDIDDGILDPDDFESTEEFLYTERRWYKSGKMYRIKGITWWPEELPSEEEMEFGRQQLLKHNNKVDYVIAHCCPQDIASFMGYMSSDRLSNYFDDIARTIRFDKWYFGHYHTTQTIFGKFVVLYDHIDRII